VSRFILGGNLVNVAIMAAMKTMCSFIVSYLCLVSISSSYLLKPAVTKEIIGRESIKIGNKYKNTKPLIGIMTQPCTTCPGKSYIAAGFVKWIEAAGARAVPVRFYATDQELARLFKSINGLIFPVSLFMF
jgi:hypothetical protein